MRPTSTTAPRIVTMIAAFLSAAVVAGILASGLALPAVGVAGVTARAGVSLFESLPSEMAVNPLAQQSVIKAKDGTVIATPYAQNRIIVPISKISKHMQNAQVAIEDERFYQHQGIDMRGTARAFVSNMSSNSTQGGSTLTQQYVKQQLLEGARRAKNSDELLRLSSREGVTGMVRKVRELKYAVALEKKYTKDQILQGYLNMVYYGDRTYGVEAAAMHYFGIPASKLNIEQSALLAGLVQAPGTTDPVRHMDRAKKRRNLVLRQMLKLKFISQAEFDQAIAAPVKLNLMTRKSGSCSQSKYPYFCYYVLKWLQEQPSLGRTPDERFDRITRDGLVIQTSFDTKKAEEMEALLKKKVPVGDPSNVRAAAVTVDPKTGYVVAMAQTTQYDIKAGPGKTAINYNTDARYGSSSGFQYGSTQKYYSIMAALDQGRSWDSTVDVPAPSLMYPLKGDGTEDTSQEQVLAVDFSDKVKGVPCGAGEGWRVKNAHEDAGTAGRRSLGYIASRSINTAFAQLNSELGFCEVHKEMKKLGLHTADKEGEMPSGAASVTLGTGNVSPMTLASSFAIMAGQGQLCTPSPVVSVTDSQKRVYQVPSVKDRCKQAVSPEVALDATKVFSQVVDHYSMNLSGGRPAAGKSGTNELGTSTWFAGVTPQYSTVVWTGIESPRNNQKIKDATIGGTFYEGFLYSTSIAAPLWQQIMDSISTDDPVMPFSTSSAPAPNAASNAAKELPDVRGLSMSQASETLRSAGYQVTTGPAWYTQRYPVGTVGHMSPEPGSTVNAGTSVELYPVAGQQYAPDAADAPAQAVSAPQPPAPPRPPGTTTVRAPGPPGQTKPKPQRT